MTFYFFIVFGIYFLLLVVLRIGWERSIRGKRKEVTDKNFFISIVIAMRNEKRTIRKLLDDLQGQDYPASDFEIIIVNDHSTDESEQVAKSHIKDLTNFKIVSLGKNEAGKKAALTKGITATRGEIIVTTDADCSVSLTWLRDINSAFHLDAIKMAMGMVRMEGRNDFFSWWQSMEFASVIGTGIATIGLRIPTMCNGANLAFRKQVFMEVDGYAGNDHIASGDDEFLMRKIQKKYSQSIHVLATPGSVVNTSPQPSVSEFISQRLRWAAKWKHNTSLASRSLSVFIFMIQVSWLLLLISIIFSDLRVDLILVVLIKITADLLFLLPVFRFLKIKFHLLPFLGLQFLYPFYVLFIGIFSFSKSNQWKGRPIN